MEELVLDKALYDNIAIWMREKYAITTRRNRLYFIRNLAKKYGVLNKETISLMFKNFKYQYQRATIVMINEYCLDENIDFYIRIPKLKVKKKDKFPEILSLAEIERMIEATPFPYNLAIRCIFNFGAGLRISEIIKFSWNHIKWIDWLANKDNYGVANIYSGKGSKDRTVNIPKALMQDLYEYAKQNNRLDEFGVPQGGMIFSFNSEKETKHMREREREIMEGLIKKDEKSKEQYIQTRYNWFRYNILQKCCEKALKKRLKIHSLRHSRSTYLYEYEKVPIERIKELLGHSSINTTMLYTRINPISTFDILKNTKEL